MISNTVYPMNIPSLIMINITIIPEIVHISLVGGVPTTLKHMKVSWDDDRPMENKKCSKPPATLGSKYLGNVWGMILGLIKYLLRQCLDP